MMLSEYEIEKIGFKSIGGDCMISDLARFYNAKNISIGDNVRIDDFCILSAGDGGITLHNHIHIGCYSSMIGQGEIIMWDYSGLSANVNIYSSTDDFSGKYYANAVVALEKRNVKSGKVIIKRASNIAAGCVIMPDLTIGPNSALGAMSFLTMSIPEGKIYAGIPAKEISSREKNKYEESA